MKASLLLAYDKYESDYGDSGEESAEKDAALLVVLVFLHCLDDACYYANGCIDGGEHSSHNGGIICSGA